MAYLPKVLYNLTTMTESDLVFLHSAYFPACAARVDKRFDGYYTLQFMASGGVSLSYAERSHRLTGAWFWTAYPGPRIRFQAAEGFPSWAHRYVAFQGPRVSQWMAEGLWPDGPQPAPAGRDYAGRFDELLANVHRAGRWGIRRATHLLELLLIDLAEARMVPVTREPWLETALTRLAATEGVPDYERLAAALGMSYSSLRARFKSATGTTPHRYVLQARVVRARALLSDTDLPLKTIADQLGYRSVYYFCRQFRQQAGAAPGAYRRSCQR